MGQTTFTGQDPQSSDIILGAASGIAYAADTLFVADANRVGAFPSNHRVLIYQGLSTMLPGPNAELPFDRNCPVCRGQATAVLGQPDFTTVTETIAANRSSLRLPTAVASDGVHVVIADTNHNRVLIWNRIPVVNNTPADVVIGQADFTTASIPGDTPTAKSMRGPQGVWIQNGKLYVADTQNNRVLIWNRVPTTNGQAADVVLGVPNFTTTVQQDLSQQVTSATATSMLNPVAVASDGVRLVVTDLGYNRVLIWNSIPTTNGQAADVVIGQPDFTSTGANNGYTIDTTTFKQTPVLCPAQIGTDTDGNPVYSPRCNATLNFPRFALPAGNRLFIADGGNDRVLVFETFPTQNGAAADEVLGQVGGTINQATTDANSMRTPMSLAWDGTNLYVSDTFNRRVLVFSLAPNILPYQAVSNSASLAIFASGYVTIGAGTDGVKTGDVVTIKINDNSYSYTAKEGDAISNVIQGLVTAINSVNNNQGDPVVFAIADLTNSRVVLNARQPGLAGNNIGLSVTTSTNSQTAAVASGSTLAGGGDAAQVAPGTNVTIVAGDKPLSWVEASADQSQPQLPTKLGGVRVYFNGIPAPLFYVSATQINTQIPWEVFSSTSINGYVRTENPADGSVSVTTPVAVTIVKANPGIFTKNGQGGNTPGMVLHGSSRAAGIIDFQGSITAKDVATVTIEDRTYSYTVQASDTIYTVRDAMVLLVNQDPKVSAEPSGEFSRLVVKARVEGPDGNGIPFDAVANSGSTLVVTPFGSRKTCCANIEGEPVTDANPAVPDEFLIVYATGLGWPDLTNSAIVPFIQTGIKYPADGPVTSPINDVCCFVSSLAGGKTADVISATLAPGTVGLFKVILHLNPDIPTDPATSVTIAQGDFVSNAVTFPVQNPGGQ